MKRVWIAIAGAVVLLAIVYGVRMAERRSSSGVAALLPRTTVAFAHLPDFNSTMDEWHHSDVYQIYREPAVQEFLRKPINQSPKSGAVSTRIQEFQELKARDAFVALTSVADDKPKIIPGFHFRCSQAVADRVIGSWRATINPSAKREQIAYQS